MWESLLLSLLSEAFQRAEALAVGVLAMADNETTWKRTKQAEEAEVIW